MGIEINKVYISVIGRTNVGKSRLINCIFNQQKEQSNRTSQLKTESHIEAVKLLLNGTLALVDTITIDDNTDFGLFTKPLSRTDFFILVLDAREELYKCETALIAHFQNNHIPFLVAVNKIEFGTNPHLLSELDALEVTYFELSCMENAGLESFRKMLIHLLPNQN
jgi:small GTP-binding protein